MPLLIGLPATGQILNLKLARAWGANSAASLTPIGDPMPVPASGPRLAR
jgi:hypothetical protein